MDTTGMDADGLAAAVTKQGSLVRQMKKVRGIGIGIPQYVEKSFLSSLQNKYPLSNVAGNFGGECRWRTDCLQQTGTFVVFR